MSGGACSRGFIDRFCKQMLRPVDAAWLAVFRIGLGLLLAVSMARFLAYGWVQRLLIDPTFHFKYWGFEWVPALPSAALHGLFGLLLLASLAVALGFWFRASALVLASGLTYVQLIDVSIYLNHYYLAALCVWLLSVSPAHRIWSMDAWCACRRRAGSVRRDQIAVGWHYLFRFQIGLVYFFAGVAKAQSDWLLHAQPLRIWLGATTDLPLLGPLLLAIETVPLLFSWCGFLFDTTIVVWLLLEKARPWAFAAVVVFHTITGLLLPIGMFPWIMVTAALVFFPPDWPRKWVCRAAVLWRPVESRRRRALSTSAGRRALRRWQDATAVPVFAKASVLLGVAYCCVQLCMPLRFLGYPGNVLWHEQGMRFSWRVMVRAKGGATTFVVKNTQTRREWHVSPRDYLTGMQEAEMSGQPDLILQLAHHIARDMRQRGFGEVEVRADSKVALNGRRSAPLIDADRNLALVKDGLGSRDWVLPAPSVPPPHTRPVL